MKKIKNFTFGGIQHKVFSLVLIMLALVIAVFTAVILYQMNSISNLVSETSRKQKEAVTEISRNTMDAVVNENLGTSTQLLARIADDMFSGTANLVKTIGEYVETLFEDPERFPVREVKEPDASLDGTASAQLLTEEKVDLKDPELQEKLGLIGNLSDVMLALYSNAGVESCYVAFPEGIALIVDEQAASKVDGDGNVVRITILDRDWYTGACENRGLYFSDVYTDLFTGQVCITCSVPVYVDGELAAVAGADLFLDNMKDYVEQSGGNNGNICIVNEHGHIVFSSVTKGIFSMKEGGEAEDLRTLGSAQLAAFIDTALREVTDVQQIEAHDYTWYMAGAPIDTVDWAVINLVSKKVIDRPTVEMSEQFDAILSEAVTTFSEELANGRTMIIVLLIIVAVIAILSALMVSRRIVKPLETMTRRVVALGGEDLQFRMEDVYRTGDEIEALAESFAMLSARTLQYVDQVRTVTAEKERIGAELHMATAIQASQLPQIFPAFPSRSEFDIYASMTPAKEVGGDFYDFFLVDDNHLGLVIADVSGKGVPAALFMMVSKILVQNCAMTRLNPKAVLENVNNQMCQNNHEEMFVTVWFGILDLQSGVLTAANAGHEYPAVKQADGSFELIKDKHGFVIGGMEGMKYSEYKLTLKPGSKLFIYTDGVAEATNADNELFGTDRMLEALRAVENSSPEEVVTAVHNAVNAFVQGAPQFDDITMLCVQYDGVKPGKPD